MSYDALRGPDAAVIRAEELLLWGGRRLEQGARSRVDHRLEHSRYRDSRSVILADGLATGLTADEVRHELVAKRALVVHMSCSLSIAVLTWRNHVITRGGRFRFMRV
ncbi:MAG TPA: hypothetical protein VKC57_05325, partial [Ktedonobacterales bacterium]|nr:hypothetical protein [Ktedonobacterales bacterium]